MELETLALGLILGGISGSIGVLYILVRLDWVKGMIYDTITGYVSQLLEETFKKPEGLALSLKPLMLKMIDDKELWRSFKPGVMMLVDEIGGEFAAKMPQGGGAIGMLGEVPLEMIPKKWRGPAAIAQFLMGRNKGGNHPQSGNPSVVG